MKSIPFLLIIFILCSFSSTAQLDKNVWLVGGSGSFRYLDNNHTSAVYNWEAKITEIRLTTNIGYFVIDKFAIGLKSALSLRNENELSISTGSRVAKSLRVDYGPFVRYYVLAKDKQFNILADVAYQFGHVKLTGEKGSRNSLSILAGPAIYFNSSVALELLVGYAYTTEKISSPTFGNPYKQIDKGLQFELGLQIHLEKL